MSTSYPLMAIAKRYGVDYGDVLLISWWFRFLCLEEGILTQGQQDLISDALDRLEYSDEVVCDAIRAHSVERWKRPV